MYTFHFGTKSIRKLCIEGSRFNKMNNFMISQKTLLRGTNFLYCEAVAGGIE